MSFGVTASDVTAYANGLTFLDGAVGPPVVVATQPSLAQVTAYIAESTQTVRALLVGLGVEPSSITQAATPDTYATCARLVKLDVAAWALMSRNRDNVEIAREYRRQAEGLRADLKSARQYLGSGRATGDDSPSLARGPVSPSTGGGGTAGLGARIVNSGSL